MVLGMILEWSWMVLDVSGVVLGWFCGGSGWFCVVLDGPGWF